MEALTIVPVRVADVKVLQQLSRDTFSETFGSMNTPENMAHYLEVEFSLSKLTAELNDPRAAFYFARLGDAAVGYLKLNVGAAQTELQDPNALEIERIYVRKAFLGQAVGQALFEQALEVARQRQSSYVWLGVWEENPRAIRFYEKNGFVAFGKHLFKLGDDEQTDILMKRMMD